MSFDEIISPLPESGAAITGTAGRGATVTGTIGTETGTGVLFS